MTSKRWNWADKIAHRLIHVAARRVPNTLSGRFEEEWLADLAAQRGPMSRLRFAFGCCWATNIIAREHAVAAVPATVSQIAHGNFAEQPQGDFPFFTGRTVTFVLVATLHVAVLYGLAMGIGPKFTRVITGPLINRPIDPLPRSPLPPPLRPNIAVPWVDNVPPEVLPPFASDPDVIQEAAREPERTSATLPPPAVINRVQGGPGTGFPSTADFYPDASMRLGETGIVTIRTCVDGNGRLNSEPTIVESSGSSRLDGGALKLARAGSGHYRATTEDGQPVASCYAFRIRFALHN
jgi:TonB family protein